MTHSNTPRPEQAQTDPGRLNPFYTMPRLVAGYFLSGLAAVLALVLGAPEKVGVALSIAGIVATTVLVPWAPPADWKGRQVNPRVQAYYDRNRCWLVPVMGLALLFGAHTLTIQLDPTFQTETAALALWLSPKLFVVGAALVAFAAMCTDTISSRVVQYVCMMTSCAAVLVNLLS